MKAGVLTVWALFLGGCLLPQEDDLLDPIPVAKNRPPRILENTVDPQRQITLGTGCELDFSAAIEDPDVNDRVTVRWYLDWQPPTQTQQVAPVAESTLQNNGQALRADRARYTLRTGGANPVSVGTHELTLMVFDGTLGTFQGPGSVPDPDPVPGVDAGNPRYAVTFDWFVTVEQGTACLEGTP